MSRATMQRILESAYETARRQGQGLGILLFSIDRFRLINGRFGYHGGDSVLAQIAALCRTGLPHGVRCGRWHADEFVCVLAGADHNRALAVADVLRQRIEHVVVPVGNTVINVTASFGAACYPLDGNELDFLMVAADEALHTAKRQGRNRAALAGDLQNHIFRTGAMLELALREQRIVPAYQPIVDLKTGEVVAEEVLARIVTADGQTLMAEQFMDVATEFQLTHKIDQAIILGVFDRCNQLGPEHRLTHFINVSGDLLRRPALLAELQRYARTHTLRHDSANPKPLVIEVTERELLGEAEATCRMLGPFVELGVKLALDDFGSGYSSFQYLADLPISYLKLDGGLIRRLHEPKVQAIVRGIHNIAAELQLITLAEYVETEQQVEFLRTTGIDWAQGHHYGKALLNQTEAQRRRSLSANWQEGFYYRPQSSR